MFPLVSNVAYMYRAPKKNDLGSQTQSERLAMHHHCFVPCIGASPSLNPLHSTA